jgi:TPR repeat protein
MNSDTTPTPPAGPPRVFISYCTEDKAVADAVCHGIEQAGHRCWIAPRDVRPGENWAGSIVKSIVASRVMVLIFSKHTNNSRHVTNEIERAVSHSAVIIPFRIDDVKPSEDLELFISSCHWLDAYKPPLPARIAELVQAVGAVLGTSSAAPPSPPPAPAPAPRRGPNIVLLAALAAAVLVILGIAGIFLLRGGGAVAESPAPAVAAPPPAVASTPPPAAPTPAAATAPDPMDQARELEESQDFVAALDIYGRLLEADPNQPELRTRAGNAIARLMEEEDKYTGDARATAVVRSVAESGVPAAQKFAGILLRASDPREAFDFFQKAAEQGDARSMAEIGLMLSNGDGVPRDLAAAAGWLKKSADAGFAEGMMLYAECLLLGKGVPEDPAGAAEWYSKAAALGNIPAKVQLARLFQKGTGVPSKDPKKAAQLYEEAVAQGSLEAQARLGAMLMTGEAGTPNPRRAVQLWQDGANKGDVVCMLFYAKSFEDPALGPPDLNEAKFWYRKAAQKGNQDAVTWCRQNNVAY